MKLLGSFAVSILLICLVLSFASSKSDSPASQQEVTREEFDGLKRDVGELRKSFEGLSRGGTRTAESVAFLSLTSPPVGTIVPFAGEWPPKKDDTQSWTEQELGWMLCDGRSFPQTDFKLLAAAISTAWGGNASNFNLPDLRGQFLRGVDDSPNTTASGGRVGTARNDPESDGRTRAGAGGNSGDKVGSMQPDATKMPTERFKTAGGGKHTHRLELHIGWGAGNKGAGYGRADGNSPLNLWPGTVFDDQQSEHDHRIVGGDQETRPKNVYVYYVIKFK
jgi:hypothetical protein